ncbi:hypothetical protein MJO29_000546 [Puccinia striiformis f. sp. tritici]|uniref:Secreted protein n=2 Tax=Puccinia striiformis f. sp. tritici TaxID=168172 RepID=A0A0L0V263_9BASI|nr:hypothetical protein Pst134EA_000545 [Puccinia striiformis f. sp. tritici]KAH9473472.1 hypothetical protein Pst134EA_000545 [Puccinia striiformis f. sp. tritici]KAI7967269.1 hypothetical protein MJO29_000546 [Puccinia striiformis f. sp. tritici]KAI9602054.1 hypothetical protein KEM48_001002 [Puccinia striiformis f. sp. tritici PST-130]KNE93383.1 hypothetical protein PSTG_13205 [Puccinia striiformis f. sp. tritici PST-78]
MTSVIAMLTSSILLLLLSNVDAQLPEFRPDTEFPISRCADPVKYPVFYCLRMPDGKSYLSEKDRPPWWDDALFQCNEDYIPLCCPGKRWEYITGLSHCTGTVPM